MEVILWLQSFRNPFLDAVWVAISHLGSLQFVIAVALLVFWCVNSRVGWLLFVLGGVSVISNEAIKAFVAEPRPDSSLVRVVMPAGGYAFPSGHTQHATVFWGFSALRIGRSPVWLIPTALLILLVGLSRLYLGVHWPADVIGGFVIGAVIVGLGNWGLTRWSDDWVASANIIYKATTLAIPLAVFAIYPADIVTRAMGFLAGLNAGYLILLPRFSGALPVRGHKPEGHGPSWPGVTHVMTGDATKRVPPVRGHKLGHAIRSSRVRLLLKAVIGLAGLFLIYLGTKALLPDTALFHFSSYAAMGLWAGFLVPLVFGD